MDVFQVTLHQIIARELSRSILGLLRALKMSSRVGLWVSPDSWTRAYGSIYQKMPALRLVTVDLRLLRLILSRSELFENNFFI